MRMLLTAALVGGLGLAAPTAGVAQEAIPPGADIRLVPVNVAGGPIDGIRAAAVAGTDVQRVSAAGLDDDVLDAFLDRRNLDITDVAAIFADANGTYWVYVDPTPLGGDDDDDDDEDEDDEDEDEDEEDEDEDEDDDDE